MKVGAQPEWSDALYKVAIQAPELYKGPKMLRPIVWKWIRFQIHSTSWKAQYSWLAEFILNIPKLRQNIF